MVVLMVSVLVGLPVVSSVVLSVKHLASLKVSRMVDLLALTMVAKMVATTVYR